MRTPRYNRDRRALADVPQPAMPDAKRCLDLLEREAAETGQEINEGRRIEIEVSEWGLIVRPVPMFQSDMSQDQPPVRAIGVDLQGKEWVSRHW